MSTTSPLIGITAEWNPFHAGHSAMIDIIKKAYPQAPLIAIMSGAFVQRGEPALFDKWTRAGWAVRSGVDAVFEFPALYALQSADRFSCHAASMLHAMGVSMIAFGAESLTKDELLTAAGWAISEDYEHLLHERIADGLSYGEAAHEAMAAASPYLASSFPGTWSIPSPQRVRGVNSCLKKGRHFFLLRTQSKPPSSWKKATTRILPAMKTAATSSPA